MAEFAERADEFARLGYKLAGVSADPPERSARLRQELALPFPLLSDTDRRLIRAWAVYNPRERGGIAQPATAVVTAAGELAWFEREGMARRVKAEALLAFLAGAGAPQARGFGPRFRDFLRALRFTR